MRCELNLVALYILQLKGRIQSLDEDREQERMAS